MGELQRVAWDAHQLVLLERCAFVRTGACDGLSCDLNQYGCEDKPAADAAFREAEAIRSAHRKSVLRARNVELRLRKKTLRERLKPFRGPATVGHHTESTMKRKFKGIDIDGDGIKLGDEVRQRVQVWKKRLGDVEIDAGERAEILEEAQEAIAALSQVLGNQGADPKAMAIAAKETAELLMVVHRALQD